ncbi:MAG TPA: hypothetical protein VLC09_08700 [Polyangiaceae bacterium]|nr:hypothetical protein [Polyangiaceae bacterium]
MSEPNHFRLCSTCKTPIAFGARYWICSVSTCNRRGTALYFCSVACWDAHVPDARHRDAWAEEETAPTREAYLAEREGREATATRRIVGAPRSEAAGTSTGSSTSSSHGTSPATENDAELPRDVLVVVSKLKAYVKARSNMSTSDGVVDVLSDHLRELANRAVRSAAQNSRKTVLARDFEAALRGTSASD